MISFVSDLDKTIIYSKNNTEKCVEYKEGKELTYMTLDAYNNFLELRKSINFIPCTLRDYEQTTRISFIKDNMPKFMICDNGASIYIDGRKNEEYNKYIKENIVDKKIVKEEIKKIKTIIKQNKIIVKRVRSNDNFFFLIIFYNSEYANQRFNIFKKSASDYFDLHLQGRKLYFMPKKLDKTIALKHLIDKYNLGYVITSGDSSVDENFVKLGDKIILPKHAVFKNENALLTQNNGIKAGEEIILNIKEEIKGLG